MPAPPNPQPPAIPAATQTPGPSFPLASSVPGARAALLLLTALNFLNNIDRSVLFAVQPLVQAEFHRSDAQFGFLTTAFFLCYMVSAPLLGWLADHHSRKKLIIGGAVLWSAATYLTAATHNFSELLLRHALVGIGEASFVAIAPAFLADFFPLSKRGRIFAFFYTAIPAGTALGYLIGGELGSAYGWRVPFYVVGAPGLLLALTMFLIPEPRRGQQEQASPAPERDTLRGLARNRAFWCVTLAGAALTFALGGLAVWMPTFLFRLRGYPLAQANRIFGSLTLFNGIVATLLGGWLGDRLLRRTAAAYYVVSAASLLLGLPVMILSLSRPGATLVPSMAVAGFLLLANTGPLNAALINSVGPRIRATALAINIIVIHLLGDALSPTLIGYISDRTSLQTGLLTTAAAVAIAFLILLYGVRLASRSQTSQRLA